MRRIRETLRLHLQAGLSYNEIGRALKLSKSVAGKYVSLARAAGVDWEVAQGLTDEELEARLYRPALPRSSHQLAPDFALVHQELKRPGVTLQLLWEEYARSNAQAYKYTSFSVKYRQFAPGHSHEMCRATKVHWRSWWAPVHDRHAPPQMLGDLWHLLDEASNSPRAVPCHQTMEPVLSSHPT
jgi:hypothetical protein